MCNDCVDICSYMITTRQAKTHQDRQRTFGGQALVPKASVCQRCCPFVRPCLRWIVPPLFARFLASIFQQFVHVLFLSPPSVFARTHACPADVFCLFHGCQCSGCAVAWRCVRCPCCTTSSSPCRRVWACGRLHQHMILKSSRVWHIIADPLGIVNGLLGISDFRRRAQQFVKWVCAGL